MIGLLSTVKFPGFHMNMWSFNKLKPSVLTSTCPGGRGGGGVLRNSGDRDDQMGAKIETKTNNEGFQQNLNKNPWTKS